MTELHKLRAKLCRELARSEVAARAHRRRPRRLGDTPPAHALRAIAAHAEATRPRFEALMRRRGRRVGLRLGRTAGAMSSALRHAVLERVIDTERSFRATLLGVRRGADVLRLLRAVAAREGDRYLAGYCDEVLAERLELIDRAERALAWFADRPGVALRSGLHAALHPAPLRAR